MFNDTTRACAKTFEGEASRDPPPKQRSAGVWRRAPKNWRASTAFRRTWGGATQVMDKHQAVPPRRATTCLQQNTQVVNAPATVNDPMRATAKACRGEAYRDRVFIPVPETVGLLCPLLQTRAARRLKSSGSSAPARFAASAAATFDKEGVFQRPRRPISFSVRMRMAKLEVRRWAAMAAPPKARSNSAW